jgi:ribonuclease T2
MRAILLILMLAAGALRAEGDRSGDFDYYVLALSWSPGWCDREGNARKSEQCGRGLGWSLHGLWPQYETGWPSYCATAEAPPSRAATGAMADIMGTAGLAWHQWRKHGTCSGLSARAYYDLSRKAYGAVARPDVFRRLQDPVRLPARVVEEAFLEANPALSADGITVTCRDGQVQEVRICLTRALEPVTCGADVVRDCTLDDALLVPIEGR